MRFLKKLREIKPSNTFDTGLLQNAGYFALEPNTYYDIEDLAGKISDVLKEAGK